MRCLRTLRGAIVAVAVLPAAAWAQDLEPGAYWPLPAGLNILTAINSFNWGDVTFDPTLPVEDASARINTSVAAYTRTLAIAGRSVMAGVQVPIVGGHLEGLYRGAPAELDRFGLGDPRVRLSVNLFGAPAMTPKEFAAYRLDTIVGASLTVAAPLGEYDNTKVVNLGTNRWSIKPELGLSHALGSWIVETMAGVWIFTDNTDFAGGRTRQQEPIGALQAHLTYRFHRSMWLAADANFYTGGQTTVGDLQNQDLQRNSRVGSTFSWAIDQHHSVRASVSRGAYTSIGANFTSVAVGYNFAWIQ